MNRVPGIVAMSLVSSLAVFAAGCDRDNDTAATNNATDTTAEQRYDNTVADAQQGARDMGTSLEQRADQAGQAIDDAAITTTIKGKYLADDSLKGLDISVETDQGVVMLSGSVQDQAARNRAAELAKNVDGVVTVNNELKVN